MTTTNVEKKVRGRVIREDIPLVEIRAINDWNFMHWGFILTDENKIGPDDYALLQAHPYWQR